MPERTFLIQPAHKFLSLRTFTLSITIFA